MKTLADYEYYRTDLGVLYCCDCLEILPLIPDNSVDFCFTDPPYNVGKDYGIYKDDLPDIGYKEKMQAVFNSLKNKTQNRMCVFPPTNNLLWFWNLLGSDYKQIALTWSPEGTFRDGFINQMSTLLTNVKPVRRTKNVWHNKQMRGLGYFFKENTFEHPGYTSEDITEDVIASFTKPENICIDPFSGTGTTGKACVKLQRKFILIEISEKYCEIAKKRIATEANQMKLFK